MCRKVRQRPPPLRKLKTVKVMPGQRWDVPQLLLAPPNCFGHRLQAKKSTFCQRITWKKKIPWQYEGTREENLILMEKGEKKYRIVWSESPYSNTNTSFRKRKEWQTQQLLLHCCTVIHIVSLSTSFAETWLDHISTSVKHWNEWGSYGKCMERFIPPTKVTNKDNPTSFLRWLFGLAAIKL